MFFTALIFGILAGSLALVIELVALNFTGSFTYSPLLPNFAALSTIALAALIEESARLLLLRQYVVRFLSENTPSWQAILAKGALFGLGFATIELALILSQESAPLMALIGIVLVHTTLSTFFLFCLLRKHSFPTFLVLFSGFVLHLCYNLILTLFS